MDYCKQKTTNYLHKDVPSVAKGGGLRGGGVIIILTFLINASLLPLALVVPYSLSLNHSISLAPVFVCLHVPHGFSAPPLPY